MRIDKLTTKFQEALADAQSLAAGRDNQYIEPVHVLAALVAQQDGSARSLTPARFFYLMAGCAPAAYASAPSSRSRASVTAALV